ncbi:hypothetical protein [Photobacterium phosphoreum]|uniref:hypothetical protein n=1 Tax=Photobacterium phosphoreum TaxID=659 RepID=UPI003B8A9007
MCLGGFGITYIPEFLCQNIIEEGRLIHILPSLYTSQIPIPVSFIYPERDLIPRHDYAHLLILQSHAFKMRFSDGKKITNMILHLK